jgi:hypothetical protein
VADICSTIQVRHGGLVTSILVAIPKHGAVLWLWQTNFFQASMFIIFSTKFGAAAPAEKPDGAC